MGDDKKFAMLSVSSVKMLGESAGVGDLPDDIATMLAEDVCYRLREVTQASTQFMKHAKRKRLNAEDFNKALRWSDVEPVHGYGCRDSLPFVHVRDTDMFVAQDQEVNLTDLATDGKVLNGTRTASVKASWVAIEGIQKLSPAKTGVGVTHDMQSLSPDLQQYYKDATKAILESDPQKAEISLSDLSRNSKVSGLLPYLVNFVACGVKMVSHDLCQLMRLMHLVDALIHNRALFLGPYLVSLISTVMYCILEPLAVSINPLNDHWALRDYAARLLSQVLSLSSEIKGKFEHQLMATLKEVLGDAARPLCSHYGAVVGLCALGTKAVEEVLVGQLSSYWPILQQVLEDTSISNSQVKGDGHKVHGAILAAAEMLLAAKQTQALLVKGQGESQAEGDSASPSRSPSPSPDHHHHHQHDFAICAAGHLMHLGGIAGSSGEDAPKRRTLAETYARLYEYLGDSLTLRTAPVGGSGGWRSAPRLVTPDLMQLLNAAGRGDQRPFRDDDHGGVQTPSRQRHPNRPRLLSGGTGREGLRPRHAKTAKKARSRAACLKDAFPLAKTIRIHRPDFTARLHVPGRLASLRGREPGKAGGGAGSSSSAPGAAWLTGNSAVWKVHIRMPAFGKRRAAPPSPPVSPASAHNQRTLYDLNAFL